MMANREQVAITVPLVENPSSESVRLTQELDQTVAPKTRVRLASKILFPCRLVSCTLVLIFVNYAVYILTRSYQIQTQYSWLCVLYYAGGCYGPDIQHTFQFHRLLMPTFLHANFAHLLGNSIAMIFFCFDAETTLRHVRFLEIYLASGVGCSLLFAAADPYTLGVGASGSISGVMGFMLVQAFSTITSSPGSYNLLLRLFVQFVFTMLFPENSIHVGHFGGFLVGLWFGFKTFPATNQGLVPDRLFKKIYTIGIVALFGMCLLVLFLVPKEYMPLCV